LSAARGIDRSSVRLAVSCLGGEAIWAESATDPHHVTALPRTVLHPGSLERPRRGRARAVYPAVLVETAAFQRRGPN